jgi:DNA processing protein
MSLTQSKRNGRSMKATEWNEAEREAYLTLALLPGIGAQRLRSLLEQFGSAAGALAAPFELLRAVPSMNAIAARTVAGADRKAGQVAFAAAQRAGCTVLVPGDGVYPERLGEIDEPPPVLFVFGNLDLLSRPAVAIVGSRDHSAYGGEVARWLGRAAAEAGLVVVSGMARGLDALAHAGALDSTGHTIGVLGNGVGVVYPAANRVLYQAVAARGLLVSEWPPGERPVQGAFPRRNRLISGLARVTVVVEAAAKSGALQTARLAADQGRDVMAVPGPITSEVSKGTNDLIRDGCEPLLELAELLAHYPEVAKARAAGGAGAPDASASPLQRRIQNLLRLAPRALTELCAGTDAAPAAVLDALTELELAGSVRTDAGGCYRMTIG